MHVEEARRHFDHSTTAWLIGEGVRHLHSADKGGEVSYQRVVELLGNRKDLNDTVSHLAKATDRSDVSLRWSLLHLLGDAGNEAAASLLASVAVAPLPVENEKRGCEGPRDGEILVRTMAVEALHAIAKRYPAASEHLLRIVEKAPDRAILIEAAKAASDLGLKEKVRERLPKEQHWILDIRRARIEEIAADPEREDLKERGFTPPKLGSGRTTPHLTCCCPK